LLQVLYSNFNSKGVKEREDTLGSSPLGVETIRRIGDQLTNDGNWNKVQGLAETTLSVYKFDGSYKLTLYIVMNAEKIKMESAFINEDDEAS